MHQNVITTQCILVKLITKSNSSLTKKESRVLLRPILKFHSEILQGKNRLRPIQLFSISIFQPETSCYCSTILFHSFCSLPKQNDQSRMSIWKYSNLYRKSYRSNKQCNLILNKNTHVIKKLKFYLNFISYETGGTKIVCFETQKHETLNMTQIMTFLMNSMLWVWSFRLFWPPAFPRSLYLDMHPHKAASVLSLHP